jgi:arylsulfatase
MEGILNVKNKSHSVTAELDIPADGAEGVIINQGGISGGWTLYLKDGRLKYGYNLASLTHTYVESPDPLPTGRHQVRMESAYDGGGPGKGATVTLYLDGNKVAEGHVEATIMIAFSADETTDIGRDTGSPVVPDYPAGSTFTGTVNWVVVDTGDDDHTHLISPEQQHALHLAQH